MKENIFNTTIGNGGNGMGELYAGFVLEGRVTSEQAVYTFYYRFPTNADGLVYTMNNVFLIEGRKDLVKTYDEIEALKLLAEENKKKYFQNIAAAK